MQLQGQGLSALPETVAVAFQVFGAAPGCRQRVGSTLTVWPVQVTAALAGDAARMPAPAESWRCRTGWLARYWTRPMRQPVYAA